MAETPSDSSTAVQWRRLTEFLWVGRRDGRHVGSIEHGHRYVVSDGEGVVVGRYRDLASAESWFDAQA
jgi:hypothetical protein